MTATRSSMPEHTAAMCAVICPSAVHSTHTHTHTLSLSLSPYTHTSKASSPNLWAESRLVSHGSLTALVLQQQQKKQQEEEEEEEAR